MSAILHQALLSSYAAAASGGGFPVVESKDTSFRGSNATTHSITMPSGIEPGNLIVVFFTYDGGSGTATPSSGWTTVLSTANLSFRMLLFSKVATGSDSLTVTTSSSEEFSAIAYRISNADNIEAVTSSVINAVDHPLPSITPSAGTKNYLFFAAMAKDADPGTGITTAPTNYTDFTTVSSRNTFNAAGVRTICSQRELNANTESGGQYTSTGGTLTSGLIRAAVWKA